VVSTDLGTPGSVVASCADSDVGDDGLLNPVRNGAAMRRHPPWTTASAGLRPSRCEDRADQYPSFLAFDARRADLAAVREEFACNALLSDEGCELEQPLESVYRALVLRRAREGTVGNPDPNAGFVRDDAQLAIVLITDEDDGSVRDCRDAEPGDPDGVCGPLGPGSATGVFNRDDRSWASDDLNLRFYLYAPGGPQDPTWPLNRYIDPRRLERGFTSLKPGRPDLVTFIAITGVPIALPRERWSYGPTDPFGIDWDALLGRAADGSDAYEAMSPGGPISMRPRNRDPACPSRVVPACRREGGSSALPSCASSGQFFAWPARRIAEVARRFAQTTGRGTISSICSDDYAGALAILTAGFAHRSSAQCLARTIETVPPRCPSAPAAPGSCATERPLEPCVNADARVPVRVRCVVREILPSRLRAADWCVPARGRRPGGLDARGRETCFVDQLAVIPGSDPTEGEGFYLDTVPERDDCAQRISFTEGAVLARGSRATLECETSQR
jgi:hypothetical protein